MAVFKAVLILLVILICQADSSTDSKALVRMKSNLTDPLGFLDSWQEYDFLECSKPCHCSWTGVTCNSDGRVIKLNLDMMELSGRISDDIQLLSELEYLNLSQNNFSTMLPASICNLTKLVFLDLNYNFFSGLFPRGMDRASKLVSLEAVGNNFTGPLPEEIGRLSRLEILNFASCNFKGSIPKSYWQIRSLRVLDLTGATKASKLRTGMQQGKLTGKIHRDVGRQSSLEILALGSNMFHNGIPREIGNLTNLKVLDIGNNNFHGTIPNELWRLTQLNTLMLHGNRLMGMLSPNVRNLTSLSTLKLNSNFISGAIPEEIGNLKKLYSLDLGENKMIGTVPVTIADLTKLTIFSVGNNFLSGRLPQFLGKNSSLSIVDVGGNYLRGRIPSDLCFRMMLNKAVLSDNGFTGSIPEELARCEPLSLLEMQKNMLSGPIPRGFGTLESLNSLKLAHNRLSHKLPDDLFVSSSLSQLDLSYNQLDGCLPSNYWNGGSMQHVYISHNNLTGEIPDRFNTFWSLECLDLSHNHLSGGIPASITGCESLTILTLQQNRLRGNIPPELALMPSLQTLDLSCNSFTGTIPPTLGSSPTLQSINVSYNHLSGVIPTEGLFTKWSYDSFVGNRYLCGGMLGSCSMDAQPDSSTKMYSLVGWFIGILVLLSLAILIAGAYVLYKRDHSPRHRFNDVEESSWKLTLFQRLDLTVTDILACINESNIIGMGSSGRVYRAEVPRGKSVVALKMLWKTPKHLNPMSGTGFVAEVDVLGNLRHRNILRLLGYCYNTVQAMLIYDYMPNGSLGEALHAKDGRRNFRMDWTTRYNIAMGVAQGLCYLHHYCFPMVLHRDIKSNNILLDSNLEAHIADFGVAKFVENNETMSMVVGSCGYIAPEYANTLKVNEKSDIYSFGVVLMELLTGRKPIEPEFGEGVSIVEWVREKLKGSQGLPEVLDSNIRGMINYETEQIMLVLQIALLCTNKLPKDRPSMRNVVNILAKDMSRRNSSSNTHKESVTIIDCTCTDDHEAKKQ